MFDKFSDQVKEVIVNSEKYAVYKNISLGTESLLLGMYKTKDSICNFLLNEYEIKYSDLIKSINSFIILRNSREVEKYTLEYKQVLKNVNTLIEERGLDSVNEEHMFYEVLKVDDNFACEVLRDLGLNVSDLIMDIEEVFDFKEEKSNFLLNLTNEARANKLGKVIGREKDILNINKIINRKNKSNVLLIGEAGVGKTAIIEGLSISLLNTKSTIYSLNLSQMISGSKYRGEFEERVVGVLENLKINDILFIDEIHNIVGTGSGEGTLDTANMLKPFLARAGFKVVGATTLKEYNKYLVKDKALTRRFQTIFVSEPDLEETYDILVGIKKEYEKFHSISIEENLLREIVNLSNRYMVNKKFPDKAIDLLDISLVESSFSKNKHLTKLDIYNALKIIVSVDFKRMDEIEAYEFKNKKIKNSIIKHLKAKLPLVLNEKLEDVIDDLTEIYGIKKEFILRLNLGEFTKDMSMSKLIGAAPGYVGFDSGGILTNHLKKYPFNVVVIENIDEATLEVKNFILNLFEREIISDNCNEEIALKNTIFISSVLAKKNKIGF